MDNYKHKNKRNWNKKSFDHSANKDSVESQENQNRESVKKIKDNCLICPRCNQPINELATALAEKDSGLPAHFDCVLSYLQSSEKMLPNQKLTYIGQGRFAVVYFPNVHDVRNFSIVKIIEWEDREKKYEWRSRIANLYSQVK